MIELAAPWLLATAPVAAAPLLLHLLRRRRPRVIGWGAMRFLAVVAAEQRRRLAVHERLLLALRTCALLAAAATAARPAWIERGEQAPVLTRAGRVACVLAIDDSAPTEAGDDIARVRELAQAWLSTLRPGDEVTVLPLSQLTEPAIDPLVDLAAAQGQIAAVRASALAPDHPGLLLAALDRLQAHLNPHAELVLVAGGRTGGWHPGDPRWNELARRLAAPTHGSRDRPHVVVLEPPTMPVADYAITAITPGSPRVAPGVRVPLTVVVAARSAPWRQLTVRIDLDGRTIDQRAVATPADGEATLVTYLPSLDAGDHLVTATLIDANDAFPLSDQRATVLVAEARLDVLLAEATPGSGLSGCLGPLAVALDPDDGADPAAPFAPRRVAASSLMDPGRADDLLAGAHAVVLGGIEALDPGTLAALERFVAAGGGLLVVPGGRVDPAHWSSAWYRAGDGVLPGPPGPARAYQPPSGAMPALGDSHPLAAAFADRGRAALAGLGITRALTLPTPGIEAPEDAAAPLLLDDGAPLVLLRRRGLGRCALLATAIDGSWGALPWTAAFVPLMRSLLTDLAARPIPLRVLAPLQHPAFLTHDGVRLIGPDGDLALTPGVWDGHPALLGPALVRPGGYSLHDANRRVLARRAVVADLAAYELTPTRAADAAAADLIGPWRADRPHSAIALVDGGERHAVELWPWLIALIATSLIAEAWLCGRFARQEAGA